MVRFGLAGSGRSDVARLGLVGCDVVRQGRCDIVRSGEICPGVVWFGFLTNKKNNGNNLQIKEQYVQNPCKCFRSKTDRFIS